MMSAISFKGFTYIVVKEKLESSCCSWDSWKPSVALTALWTTSVLIKEHLCWLDEHLQGMMDDDFVPVTVMCGHLAININNSDNTNTNTSDAVNIWNANLIITGQHMSMHIAAFSHQQTQYGLSMRQRLRPSVYSITRFLGFLFTRYRNSKWSSRYHRTFVPQLILSHTSYRKKNQLWWYATAWSEDMASHDPGTLL